jgi:glc operon protein GlcG
MRNKPVLTSGDVDAIMAAARAEAEKNSWPVTIAVVDDHGALLQLLRRDGANPTSADVATAKAKTAAIAKMTTAALDEIGKQSPGIYRLPALLVLPGGVPIMHAGECVGGVGVSGVQGHQDAQVAAAGAAALAANS